jgi:DNA polymerase-1
VKKITKAEWQAYKQGKTEYKKHLADKKYVIQNKGYVDAYRKKKKFVSSFFKLKSEYQRLCLNNPVQARGAMMLKRATARLFNWILENNYTWRIKIVNTIHDEIVLECEESLKDIAKSMLETCMVEEGNYYLSTLKIKADANYGCSWGQAK